MLSVNENQTEMYEPFYDSSGKIAYKEIVCPFFKVNRIIEKIPNTETPDVELLVKSKSMTKTIRIKGEALSSQNKLMSICSSNLFIVKPAYHKIVTGMIVEQAQQLIDEGNFAYEHTILGWNKFNGKNYFFLNKVDLDSNRTSTCVRQCGKFTNGNEDLYDKMLENCVFSYAPMSLAYCIGFASVLSGLISSYCDLGVPIIGLTGRSTTGKTTALKLIASIWGDTDDAKGTTILKNYATDIGFKAQYSGLYGYPICFDDIDTNQKFDMETFLYHLSQGTQRTVSDINGKAKFDREGFSGLAIITGENPLTDRTSKKMGLFARIVELNEIKWTINGNHSTKIKNCIATNYGFKGKKFALFLQEKSISTLIQQFNQCKQIIEQKITNKDKFIDRTAKKIALIYQTIQLVNECFGLTLDENNLISYVINAEVEQQNKRNRGKLAYDFIYNFYKNNKNSFDIKHKRGEIISQAQTDRIGIALTDIDRVDLYIPTQKARQILKNNDFPQITSYQIEWKENGYIKCENGRYDKSNSELGRHYHFVYEFQNTDEGEI